MKKRPVYIISLLFLIVFSRCNYCECTAQNTTDMTTDTILTGKFECLDIEFLKKEGKMHFPYEEYPTYVYEKRHNNGVLCIYVYGNQNNGFTQYVSLDTTNYLSLYKSYYPDGKIEQKGILNDLGFHVGKWYEFDPNGNLIKETDEDAVTPFTFEQLKEVVKKDSISLDNLKGEEKINRIKYPIKVSRGSDHYKYGSVWVVNFNDPQNREDGLWGTSASFFYDGKTGKLLEKQFSAINP